MKILKAQLLPQPLSNAMEYKEHHLTLVWQESRMGPDLCAVECFPFPPGCPVPAGWIQQTWEATCATSNRSPPCPGKVDQSGGVQKLFLHICCTLSEVTHPSPATAHPTPWWSCKAVCHKQVLIGITMLWTSGLWNHSTEKLHTLSDSNVWLSLLLQLLKKTLVMDRADELWAKSSLCYCRLCGSTGAWQSGKQLNWKMEMNTLSYRAIFNASLYPEGHCCSRQDTSHWSR